MKIIISAINSNYTIFTIKRQRITHNNMGNCTTDDVKESSLSTNNHGMVAQLKMTSYTEENSKVQLFNYESQKVHKHTYHIIHDCIVSKAEGQKKHIKPYSNFVRSEEDAKMVLFQVYKKHNYFKIVPFKIDVDETSVQKNIWLVVRSLPHKKYHLRQKDVIKIGRQKIKIRQIILEDHHLHNAVIDLSQIKTKKKVYDQTRFIESSLSVKQDGEVTSIISDSQFSCRICLQPGQTINPLISPCMCTGSVKYVHIKCLRTWLNTRLNVEKHTNYILVKWTSITCEVCKNHFKYRVFLDNKKYYSLQIPKPEKPYIVLQIVGKTVEYSKMFMFVSFHNKKTMSIGRTKAVDIQLKDQTISRHHASLLYNEAQKRFYINDHNSKFGTFAYIEKNMLVNPHQRHISFQIGGELFSFEALRSGTPFKEYQQEQRYLNVVQKGSGDVLASDSSQGQQEPEQLEDQISLEEEEDITQEVRLAKNVSNFTQFPTALHLPEIAEHPLNNNLQIKQTK